jgi:Histidinol-phosphate/aromatic aminotransferase and cobyric acid decarboxylase
VFAIWKGKLPREIFEIGQQGYAAAEPVVYPEGVEVIDCGLGTNPLGMPESLSRFLEGAGGCNLCDYPAPEPEDLKAAIAVAHGSVGHFPGAGADRGGSMGVLVTLVRLLLRPGSVISGVSPQFTDTVLQALYNGASYDPARWRPPLHDRDGSAARNAREEAGSPLPGPSPQPDRPGAAA